MAAPAQYLADAAKRDAIDEMTKKTADKLYKLENRIRKLEGQPELSRDEWDKMNSLDWVVIYRNW